jgi:hypothetical protein
MEKVERVIGELKAFEKNEAEHDAGRLAFYDTDHWFCVCFPTRAAADEALARLGYEPGRYIDGEDFMRRIGEVLQAKAMPWPSTRSQLTPEQVDELAANV